MAFLTFFLYNDDVLTILKLVTLPTLKQKDLESGRPGEGGSTWDYVQRLWVPETPL